MNQLIKKREELKLEYYSLLDEIQRILRNKNERIKKNQEKLRKKSIFYKTFKRRKYLLELNNLKVEAKEINNHYHDIEEIKKIKKRIIEINNELVSISNRIEELSQSRRL